ncbi:MAG: peptide deformylase [Paracoccaceae bacterium]|nr:MAG: peptide deformylase [Paracoccaceae bacterium]
MTVRACLRWPHPVLRTPAAPVGAVTAQVRAIWDDMVDTMEAMPGYGLAAPQIGIALRLAVVDCSAARGQAVRMADPEILLLSDDLFAHDEASPNLPGIHARLERPRRVTLRFLNAAGEHETRAFEGLWSTSAQHQIDHLEGRMFFDRLSRLRRDMLLRRARKAEPR